MTVKLTKKDIFSLGYITIITIGALGYGFSEIPSPIDQRARNYDMQRVSDLQAIKSQIYTYQDTHSQLPESLDSLATKGSVAPLRKIDPETNVPYEYRKINDETYELCATFTTDSKDAQEYANSYMYYEEDFYHGVGRTCFTIEAPLPKRYDQTNVVPTIIFQTFTESMNASQSSSNSSQSTY